MFQNLNFSFVKHSKIFFIISALLISVGLIGLILVPFKVYLFNFDIDFVGGTTMQFELNTEVNRAVLDDVSDIFKEVTGQNASSVTKGGNDGTQVIIKSAELDSETRDAVFEAVKQAYSLPEDATPIKSDYVSASVGADLRNAAFIASAVAALLILVYITIRFEFRSGLAAVCALVHDLLVMLSMYIIFQIPFNMNFIAAALTILGYSINATIVVFDRIREDRKLNPKADFGDTVDCAIRQTMTRSLYTTVTTLFSIVMLLILGVSSIRNFALPLLIGIISGCYSSVCISGPLWNVFRGKGKKGKPAKAAKAKA